MDLGKKAHGMNWGLHQRVGDNWRIGMTSHGGCLERLNSIDETTGDMIVKFGNDFGPKFIRPSLIPHSNWYFWDNPEIPQLLNPNPANPLGNKDFVRFPKGSLFTEQFNSVPDSSRLEAVLHDLSLGTATLENIIRPVPVRMRKSRRVLICPSSPNCFTYYYGYERNSWLSIWLAWCKQHGYEAEIRGKPDRTARVKNPNVRLYEHLILGDYAFTISQHSVAAVESIMAGVPAVVTGPNPIGPLGTTQEQAESGDFVLPDSATVWDWIRRIASNTYHKRELFSGGWYQ